MIFGITDDMKVLIVKSSALGDIIQCFPVLNYLHQLFPNVRIDWVVKKPFVNLVQAHPLINRAIICNWSEIRKETYDYVFDLQGNCKSGLFTFLAKSKRKIGFSYLSAREWPNVFTTHIRFSVSKNINIRLQYLSILEQYFQKKIEITQVFSFQSKKKFPQNYQNYVMVCPSSRWVNKQLKEETLSSFLFSLYKQYSMRFLFVWGTQQEKEMCMRIQTPDSEVFPMRLEFTTWANLMNDMELVIAVDSSALHLCGTTKVPSFSIFGPTIGNVFKPLGEQHYAFQGKCPYNRIFVKQCPVLRTCPTGACMKDIALEKLVQEFHQWYSKTVLKSHTVAAR